MTTEDGDLFMSPAEIYEKITGGDGLGSIQREQTNATRELEREQDRADQVMSLAKAIREGWQGEAASAAYGVAMPLAEQMIGNAIKLKYAGDLLARQSESFQTAYHSVRPISDPPEGSVDEKFPFDVDHEIAVKKYRDDAQNNLYVYGVYDEASRYNETNMPQEYLAGERTGGGAVDVDPGEVIKIGDPGPGEPRPGNPRPGGPGPGGWFTDGPYRGSNPGGSESGGFDPGPGGSVGGSGAQTGPTEYRPSSRPPAAYPLPTYPEPGQPSPVSGGPGFVGGVPVGGYPGGGPGGFGPRGGSPGAGGFGPRGNGGPGSGGVRGPGGAAGAGALAAEEAAARRAAQAATGGRPGAGPMGAPVGAGRGKNDEDNEHQRKVLIESDGEALFGSDVLTAPQVIGDDEYED